MIFLFPFWWDMLLCSLAGISGGSFLACWSLMLMTYNWDLLPIPRMLVANKGLGWDSLLQKCMLCHPGGDNCSWWMVSWNLRSIDKASRWQWLHQPLFSSREHLLVAATWFRPRMLLVYVFNQNTYPKKTKHNRQKKQELDCKMMMFSSLSFQPICKKSVKFDHFPK